MFLLWSREPPSDPEIIAFEIISAIVAGSVLFKSTFPIFTLFEIDSSARDSLIVLRDFVSASSDKSCPFSSFASILTRTSLSMGSPYLTTVNGYGNFFLREDSNALGSICEANLTSTS